MSYIDTFDHELVGFFAGLPVYHPLEIVEDDPTNPENFGCTPNNLVIGGGSGEHPALVLHLPECAVAHFILDWLSQFYESGETTNKNQPPISTDFYFDFFVSFDTDLWKTFNFAGWKVEDYHEFFERCQSKALYSPYRKDSTFESWLARNFGEFICFAMPELVPAQAEQLYKLHEYIKYPTYLNVLLPPPGYPHNSGRKIIDGKVTYGHLRWSFQKQEEV